MDHLVRAVLVFTQRSIERGRVADLARRQHHAGAEVIRLQGQGSRVLIIAQIQEDSPRGQQLLVRNTPENLRRIDALLRQLDAVEQPMIMVEAKLIELTDTNLNELGFEWMFSAGAGNGKWSLGTTDPTRHGVNGEMFRVLNNFKIFPNFLYEC